MSWCIHWVKSLLLRLLLLVAAVGAEWEDTTEPPEEQLERMDRWTRELLPDSLL